MTTTLWATVGMLFALAGAGALIALRFAKAAGHVRLSGVGAVSRVTLVVVGFSLLGAGYHVFTHALGLMEHFRAPLRLALAVAILAILGSIAIDALENRLVGRTDRNQH